MCTGSVVINQPAQARVYINIMHCVYIYLSVYTHTVMSVHTGLVCALQVLLMCAHIAYQNMCTYSLLTVYVHMCTQHLMLKAEVVSTP